MNWQDRIVSDPDHMPGEATVKGTNIPVVELLDQLSSGKTVEDLLQSYPDLRAEDVYACLAFAAGNPQAVNSQ